MVSRILVVDDDPDIVELVASAIASDGHLVVRAHGGDDAIARLRTAEFDVVVSDVRMPDASGFDVLALVKQRAPGTEVILTTAYATMPTAVECLRAGGFDFVEKPIVLPELLATVARACEFSQLRRAADALLATHEPASVPRAFVEAAIAALGADDATLLTPGRDGRLHVAYASGPQAAARTDAKNALGEGVAGRVAVEGTVALLTGLAAADPRFAGIAPSPRGVGASLVYPLTAQGRVVGVLCANRFEATRPFGPSDVRLVAILAAQGVLALENAGVVSQHLIVERMTAVGRAAAEVVHEVSNPLSCVLASLEYARAAMDPRDPIARARWAEAGAGRGPVAEAIDDALEAARAVRATVAEVRSMARAEAPDVERFDLGDVIRSAARLARSSVPQAPAITLEMDTALDVAGSARAIAQVLINLLYNAADTLTESATPSPRITVSARREGEGERRVRVVVGDNGPGVTPEVAAHIFDPYFTARGGSGVGLVVSRDIVRRHGGELFLDPDAGPNARFAFTLPLMRPVTRTTPPSSRQSN